MALIKCPICDKKISDKAKKCPYCNTNFKIHEKKMKTTSFFKKYYKIMIIIIITFIMLITSIIIIKNHQEKKYQKKLIEMKEKVKGKWHQFKDDEEIVVNIFDDYIYIAGEHLDDFVYNPIKRTINVDIYTLKFNEDYTTLKYFAYELTKANLGEDYNKVLKISNIETEEKEDYLKCTGRLTNNGKYTYQYIKAEIHFYNVKDQSFIHKDYIVRDLKPNESVEVMGEETWGMIGFKDVWTFKYCDILITKAEN